MTVGGALLGAPPKRFLVYIGTYTSGKSKGIYAYRFDLASAKLEPLGLAAETSNPPFLAIHPSRKYLYAAITEGFVAAYAIDLASGKLKELNRVGSKGVGPCYVRVDHSGRGVLVANFGSGTVAALPVRSDGSVGEATAAIQHKGSGPHPQRQASPHAHSINLSPDNRFAIAADLGIDQLLIYRFDPANGTLVANDPPFAKVNRGAGPRHFAFHPSGRYAYVINEIDSTVTAFTYDRKSGVLKDFQTASTLPADYKGGNSTAEVQVHPSGRFLYGSNRGHDSIAVFTIDKGKLTPAGHTPTQGRTPRNFGIDPTGAYLFAANQNSDNIVLFRIDGGSGQLTPAGQVLGCPTPVCVKFVELS